MKNINFYGLFFFSIALIITNSCTSDEEPFATTTETTSTPLLYNNTETEPALHVNNNTKTESVLHAFAGLDNQVILPTDYIILRGGYSYLGKANDIDSFLWTKISGPSTYIIENPNLIDTKVSNMGKGVYEFELTVTDKGGLTAKDTIKIIVGKFPSTPKEIISKDMKWIFPWYNAIEIKNFNLLMIQSIFKVYIQRDNNSEWIEVLILSDNLGSKYEYFIETRLDGAGMYNNGSLYIFYYGNDTDDTPNVKILY